MKKLPASVIKIILFVLITSTSALVSASGGVPTPDHVVIVILENHGYSQIIGSANAPHINALATDPYSALFTHSFAIEHPSQPNYLDLYSGCNQGITNDNLPVVFPFTTANLGRQLIDAGKTFSTYSESLPSVGYNGVSSGTYVRKHNPAANWMGTGPNQIPTSTNQPLTAFPSSNFSMLPTVCLVIPNMTNDMHNGTDPTRITTGDTWVYNHLNNYIQWAETHNSLLILTFDENDNSSGNQITTIFTGAMVQAGQYADTINHYSVLRTIEDMYNLPYACNAANASPITSCFTVTGINDSQTNNEFNFSVYPDPFSDQALIHFRTDPKQKSLIEIVDATGRSVLPSLTNANGQNPGECNYIFSPVQAGIYFVKLTTGNHVEVKKIICTKE